MPESLNSSPLSSEVLSRSSIACRTWFRRFRVPFLASFYASFSLPSGTISLESFGMTSRDGVFSPCFARLASFPVEFSLEAPFANVIGLCLILGCQAGTLSFLACLAAVLMGILTCLAVFSMSCFTFAISNTLGISFIIVSLDRFRSSDSDVLVSARGRALPPTFPAGMSTDLGAMANWAGTGGIWFSLRRRPRGRLTSPPSASVAVLSRDVDALGPLEETLLREPLGRPRPRLTTGSASLIVFLGTFEATEYLDVYVGCV